MLYIFLKKIWKIIVTKFSYKKNNLQHYGQKWKKWVFLKLFLGFHFWTFLKMSNFWFPFYFLEKFYNFWKLEIKKYLTNTLNCNFSVPKSKKGNENWTFLKMSKNEKPKKFWKSVLQKVICDHNALKMKIWVKKLLR